MDELERRLNHPDNLINILHTRNMNDAGRRSDVRNLTIPEKTAVVLLSDEIGNKESAAVFDLSPQQVSHLRTGKSGGEELKKKIAEKRGDIQDMALDKLMESLKELTVDRFTGIKTAKDAASIAKDLATVVGKMDEDSGVSITAARVLVYAPQSRPEEEYDTITVNAEEI